MRTYGWMLVAALALPAAGARAQDASALIASKGCTMCHAVDTRKVGPAFDDIADQYDGNAGAEATLVAKLRDGTGHPKIAATEAEIKAMVDYVLSLK